MASSYLLVCTHNLRSQVFDSCTRLSRLIPVVLVFSMSVCVFLRAISSKVYNSSQRGITASPRIQVYKAIACRALNEGRTDANFTNPMGCESSDVQARAARIQAGLSSPIPCQLPSSNLRPVSAVVTTMSVLSAISTGFWSRLGDSHGRKPILIIFISGALLMCVSVLSST